MNWITQLRRYRWILLTRRKQSREIKNQSKNDVLKLNIGSGDTIYDGWKNLDLPFFDLTSSRHWKAIVGTSKPKNILLEHVLEHLCKKDVYKGIELASKYMAQDGVIRIAVPDRLHPNPDYIEYVRPGGSGAGAYDHKSFWAFSDFESLADSLGLSANFLEYYDLNGELKYKELNIQNGPIRRTFRKINPSGIQDYSSLIVDLKKE